MDGVQYNGRLSAHEKNLLRWTGLTAAMPEGAEKRAASAALLDAWNRYSDDMIAEHLTPSDRLYLASIHISLSW